MIHAALMYIVIHIAAISLYATPAIALPSFNYGLRHWAGQGKPVRARFAADVPGELFLFSAAPPGELGKVTIAREQYSPFYVHDGTLYQITNSSHVLFANIMNTTAPGTARQVPHFTMPTLHLQLSERKSGLPGIWTWSEDKTLHYIVGGKGNGGVFYSCMDSTRAHGLFLDFPAPDLTPTRGRPAPATCTPISLYDSGP